MLLADRLDGGELVEQQVGAERGDLANRLGLACRDPHGRMRLLSGGRLHHDLVVVPEPTLVGEAAHRSSTPAGSPPETRRSAPLPPPPARGSRRTPNAGSPCPRRSRDARRREDRGSPRARPAAPGHARAARAPPSPPGSTSCGGHPAQEIQGRRHLPGAREVVLDQERRIEPEAFGFDAGLDELPKAAPGSPSLARGAWAPPNRPKRIASQPHRSRLRSRSPCGLEGAVKSGRCGGQTLVCHVMSGKVRRLPQRVDQE